MSEPRDFCVPSALLEYVSSHSGYYPPHNPVNVKCLKTATSSPAFSQNKFSKNQPNIINVEKAICVKTEHLKAKRPTFLKKTCRIWHHLL